MYALDAVIMTLANSKKGVTGQLLIKRPMQNTCCIKHNYYKMLETAACLFIGTV